MRKEIMPAATLIAFTVLALGGLERTGAQAQEEPENPVDNQRLEQEAAASRGTLLYLSPADVRVVQQALNQFGYDAGHVTGAWSEETRTAVRNFQQAHGLEPTGTPTIGTIQLIESGLVNRHLLPRGLGSSAVSAEIPSP